MIETVTTEDGVVGTIAERTLDSHGQPQLRIVFPDMASMIVPESMIIGAPGGAARLKLTAAALRQMHSDDASIVLPVIAETLQVGTRAAVTGELRVRTVVQTREETVDQPLKREELRVERVARNVYVDAVPETRDDGETMIIPLVEEVLVVERRLMLREELHITRVRSTFHSPQTVTLRREEVIVERVDAARREP